MTMLEQSTMHAIISMARSLQTIADCMSKQSVDAHLAERRVAMKEAGAKVAEALRNTRKVA